MTGFIEELHREHIELQGLLGVIRKNGLGSSEGSEALIRLIGKLRDHVQKEGDRLYPPLIEAARRTDVIYGLEGRVKEIAHEMDGLSGRLAYFVAEYGKNSENPENDQNFHRLADVLNARIRQEEETVFRFYEKLVE